MVVFEGYYFDCNFFRMTNIINFAENHTNFIIYLIYIVELIDIWGKSYIFELSNYAFMRPI